MNNKKLIFCIGSQRSGTTALQCLFRNIPRVSVFGEVFDNNPDLPYFTAFVHHFYEAREIAEIVISKSKDTHKTLDLLDNYFDYLTNLSGEYSNLIYVDIKYSFLYGILAYPRDSLSSGLIEWIAANRDRIKIINLQRWNKLDQYISMTKSSIHELWFIDNDTPGHSENESIQMSISDYNSRLTLDKYQLQYAIQKLALMDELCSFTLTSILEPSSLLQIYYEDLFLSQPGEINHLLASRIEEFVDLPNGSLPLVPRSKKLLQRINSDIIANVDDVRRWLTEIKSEHFLC